MNGQDKDQKDWDEYLSGKDGVSGEYHRQSQERSPDHLDRAILQASRDAVRRKTRVFGPFGGNWMVPVSLAAVLIITVTVVPLMQETLRTPEPVPTNAPEISQAGKNAASETGLPKSTNRAAEKPASAPAPVMKQKQAATAARRQEEQKKSLQAYRDESTKLERKTLSAPGVAEQTDSMKEKHTAIAPKDRAMSGASLTAPAKAISVKPAEEWLKEIRKLLDDNRQKEAEESLREFRKHYPDYPVEKILGPEYQKK